jgi:hypothetical protein
MNPDLKNEIKLEPVTASVWVERTFIVCVNPVNPDDKMEFNSFVEMNNKLFALKAEVERLTLLQVETLDERNKADVDSERLSKISIDPASVLRLTEDGKQRADGAYETRFTIEINREAFERLSRTMAEYWESIKKGQHS